MSDLCASPTPGNIRKPRVPQRLSLHVVDVVLALGDELLARPAGEIRGVRGDRVGIPQERARVRARHPIKNNKKQYLTRGSGKNAFFRKT